MSSNSNDTSSPYKSEVECEVVGSKLTGGLCNLLIGKKIRFSLHCMLFSSMTGFSVLVCVKVLQDHLVIYAFMLNQFYASLV